MPSAKNNGLLVRKKIKNKVKKLLTIKNIYAIIIIWQGKEIIPKKGGLLKWQIKN